MDLSTVFSPEHYHWKLGLLLPWRLDFAAPISVLPRATHSHPQADETAQCRRCGAARRTRDHYKSGFRQKSMMGSLMIMYCLYTS